MLRELQRSMSMLPTSMLSLKTLWKYLRAQAHVIFWHTQWWSIFALVSMSVSDFGNQEKDFIVPYGNTGMNTGHHQRGSKWKGDWL